MEASTVAPQSGAEVSDLLAALESERAHYERRGDRMEELRKAGRVDYVVHAQDAAFIDGVRTGVEIAIDRVIATASRSDAFIGTERKP